MKLKNAFFIGGIVALLVGLGFNHFVEGSTVFTNTEIVATSTAPVATTTVDVYQETFGLIAEITQSIEDDTVQLDQIDSQINRLHELKAELKGYITEQEAQKETLLNSVNDCLEHKCNQ